MSDSNKIDTFLTFLKYNGHPPSKLRRPRLSNASAGWVTPGSLLLERPNQCAWASTASAPIELWPPFGGARAAVAVSGALWWRPDELQLRRAVETAHRMAPMLEHYGEM
jgi:hypothetical protein